MKYKTARHECVGKNSQFKYCVVLKLGFCLMKIVKSETLVKKPNWCESEHKVNEFICLECGE